MSDFVLYTVVMLLLSFASLLLFLFLYLLILPLVILKQWMITRDSKRQIMPITIHTTQPPPLPPPTAPPPDEYIC